MNVIGVKHSTRINLFLYSLYISLRPSLSRSGVDTIFDFPHVFDHISISVPNVDWSPSWGEFSKGVAMAMVAYTGIESIAQLSS